MRNRMSLRRRAAVTVRGFGILKSYCPGLVQEKALYELIRSLQPFITVWFSARIIDELSARRSMKNIALYVACAVLVNFICSIAKKILNTAGSEKESQMWCWFGKIFSDRQMALDFEDLENAEIQRKKQEIEENLYMFGNGLAQLVWGTAALVSAAVNIIVSLAMTASLFLSKSGNRFLDQPVCAVAVLVILVLGGLSNSKAVVKENQIFMKWCENTVWFNRTFMFFGRELYINPEKAMDVRIYEQNKVTAERMDKLMQSDRDNQTEFFKMAVFPAAANIIIGLANAACYLFVAAKAYCGAFGVGSIVQYAAVLSRFGAGIQELMFIQADNKVYCQYLQKMFEYLDFPSHMYQGTLTVEKREDREYLIEFCDVSFRYPGTENDVLRHINFKFRVGEKLAVVGRNGSGKTTFIKLLCRLYDPTEGKILLNGVDIRKYDYHEYMALFSVVFQDYRLFSFSLGQNVAASVDYDRVRAEECLQKAGFRGKMPKGLDTYLYKDFEESGVELSGGEAQKVALARALYRDAPFIILDEPTAALDPIAEYEVYSKFNEIAGDRTAVYISHRLASCRFCDAIAVFDEGEIVQQGSHEKLVSEKNGRYYELWTAQAKYYEK